MVCPDANVEAGGGDDIVGFKEQELEPPYEPIGIGCKLRISQGQSQAVKESVCG